MIWSIPFIFFVCIAAVQAMRRHWQNALSATLAAALSLAIMACAGQSHANAMLRAQLYHYESKAKKIQIESANGVSNQASQTIGASALQSDR
jgi:uncharacterized membrane protein YoaK (UPF0700 family)